MAYLDILPWKLKKQCRNNKENLHPVSSNITFSRKQKRGKNGLICISEILLIVSLNVPSSKGVSAGPKMTAFHCIILLSQGAPLTPAGGSS